MKKIRLVISIFLIAMVVTSWFSFVSSEMKSVSQRSKYEEEAALYMESGLYQKAIEAYENAQKEKYKTGTAEKLIEAMKSAYFDGTGKASAYTSAYLELCCANPEKTEYWRDLFTFCIEQEDYATAFSVYTEMNKLKVKKSELYELTDKVVYYCSEKNKIYNILSGNTVGYYSAFDGRKWRVVSSENDSLYEDNYSYIGGVSSNLDVILVGENDVRLKDKNDVVQAILTKHTENMRAYGNGMIPMQQEDELWNYYNTDAKDYTLTGYVDASTFQNGIAAVKDKNGWQIINTDGTVHSDTVFTDVKLYDNGEFVNGGFFVAAVDGVYNLYNIDCVSVTSINAVDMDGYHGSYIAYCDSSNKWGYMDTKGNVVIEPMFTTAKSFSNGLAGVSDGENWAFVNQAGRIVSDYCYMFIGYNSADNYCPVGNMYNEYFFVNFKFM